MTLSSATAVPALPAVVAAQDTIIQANAIDYLLVAIYFVFVLGIGFMARRQVSDSIDFFLSGRSLPAWVTGLAFVSANLGAVEIMGMSATGAELGIPTVHYFWVGAIPAMLFLGVVMMPFYYGSKVRSVPEFMLRRFGPGAHLVNALSFAVAQLLIAGVNLFLLASIVHALLGWPQWVALIVAAAVVLSYITLGGLSAAIYNEVLQFFVIVAALLPLTLIGLSQVGGWNGLKERITENAGVGGSASAAERDVGEDDDGRDDQRDDQRPAQQPVDDLAQQEEVDAGDQQLRQREAQRVDQVSRGAVTLEHELGHRADLRAVVERHHHDTQEEHRRDGADPEVVEGRHPVLGAVGRHAHDLDSTQIGRDERDAGDPSGQ